MRTLVLAICATFASLGTATAATLTGATLFTAGPLGNSTLEVWNTVGGDIPFNLYLLDGVGVGAVNSGNGANTSINIPLLNPGSYTFRFRAQPALQNPGQFGLNLFFGGETNTPSISALVTANSSMFVANGAPLTNRLDGLPITPGSGTLEYILGDIRVTLTALSQERAGGNTVGGYTSNPGLIGGNDFRGSFTLTVETPEPSTYLMLGMGLAGLAVLRRRR
jgi:hypothetical protein